MSTATTTPSAEIRVPAAAVASDVVWATLATVGPDGRPRTRIVHPVIEWTDAPVGWITSRPTPLRRRHLAAVPWVSLSYWSPQQDCLYVDARAEWVPTDGLEDAWDRIARTPEPVGFDPATIWPDGPASETFAVIRLELHRVQVSLAADAAEGRPALLWSREPVHPS